MVRKRVGRFFPLAAGCWARLCLVLLWLAWLPAAHASRTSRHSSPEQIPWQTSSLETRVRGCNATTSGRLFSQGFLKLTVAPTFDELAYEIVSGRRQWPNRDPLGIQGGVNLYRYCGNGPVNSVDALGLERDLDSDKPSHRRVGVKVDAKQKSELEARGYAPPYFTTFDPDAMLAGVHTVVAASLGFVDWIGNKLNLDAHLSELLLALPLMGPIKAPLIAEEEAFAYYLKQAQTLDVATAKNSAVFYSGADNRLLAEQFAAANDKVTLEMTPGGKWLDQQQLFQPNSPLTIDQAVQVWSTISQRFADAASGTAVGFVSGANSGSIFNAIEYPALINNRNVVNVVTGGH